MYPKINEYLYIQVASSDAAEAEVEYRSRIAETEEDAFLIEIPMQESNGRLKRLFMGDELSVYFLTEGGIKNYFNTYVLGFKEDVIRMVRIQKPETDSIFKIQRRSFFRVNADLELAVKDSLGKRFLFVQMILVVEESPFWWIIRLSWRLVINCPAGYWCLIETEAQSMSILKVK